MDRRHVQCVRLDPLTEGALEHTRAAQPPPVPTAAGAMAHGLLNTALRPESDPCCSADALPTGSGALRDTTTVAQFAQIDAVRPDPTALARASLVFCACVLDLAARPTQRQISNWKLIAGKAPR